jgi:hypothetical protein
VTRRYVVRWVPGTDHLIGTCHCGATREADDPVNLWDWLYGHPEDHARRDGHP